MSKAEGWGEGRGEQCLNRTAVLRGGVREKPHHDPELGG